MKRIDINISKTDIYGKVQMESEYAGKKDPADSALYARVMVQDENFELLDTWWEDGVYALVESMSHYVTDEKDNLGGSEDAEEPMADLHFGLLMPDNWLDMGNIVQQMEQYMTGYLLGRWMMVAKEADLAQTYLLRAETARKNIKTILKARKRPKMI